MSGYRFFAFDNFVIPDKNSHVFLDLSINKKKHSFTIFLEKIFTQIPANAEVKFYFSAAFLPEAKEKLIDYVEQTSFAGRVLVCVEDALNGKSSRAESEGVFWEYADDE